MIENHQSGLVWRLTRGCSPIVAGLRAAERWSAGVQPSGEAPASYDVSFAEDRAEFVRRAGAIATPLEMIVSWEDDAEIRRVSLTNDGRRTPTIEARTASATSCRTSWPSPSRGPT